MLFLDFCLLLATSRCLLEKSWKLFALPFSSLCKFSVEKFLFDGSYRVKLKSSKHFKIFWKKRNFVKFIFEKLNKLPKRLLTCLTTKIIPLLQDIQKNIQCNNVHKIKFPCKQHWHLFSWTVLMILRKVLYLSWGCHSLVTQFILLLRIPLIVKGRLNERMKGTAWGVCWRDGPKSILDVIKWLYIYSG